MAYRKRRTLNRGRSFVLSIDMICELCGKETDRLFTVQIESTSTQGLQGLFEVRESGRGRRNRPINWSSRTAFRTAKGA